MDNDAARYGLVKGYSPVEASMDILKVNARVDLAGQARAWYCRVNTSSNPGDAASRLDSESVLRSFPGAKCLPPEILAKLWKRFRFERSRRSLDK